jgi:hypothetical protein
MITEATARAIYEDALAAYADSSHPCHFFRYLQRGVPDSKWQLPEPFNGHGAGGGIAFMGLNPSYDPDEVVPAIGTSFREWNLFYRTRFDSDASRWHKLYRRYQDIGRAALGSEFQLGRDGVVLEAVRYRSKNGEGCWDPAVSSHEQRLTRRLVEEAGPRILVTSGSAATRVLANMFPEFGQQLAASWRITSPNVEGIPVRVQLPDSQAFVVVPVRHLTGARGLSATVLERLRAAVRGAP